MNKILLIILGIVVIAALVLVVPISTDWKTPVKDEQGNVIGDIQQQVTLTFSDGTKETLTSGSSPVLGAITYKGKNVHEIEYRLGFVAKQDGGTMTLDVSDFRVKLDIVQNGIPVTHQYSHLYLFDGPAHVAYVRSNWDPTFIYTIQKPLSTQFTTYIEGRPSWNVISLFGECTFEFVTSGTLKYKIDGAWMQVKNLPSTLVVDIKLV